ncbi:MAG: hypothetical protein LBL52_03300 [Rickettsiales bacterium]|jgi:hypothetical protein|nr:hypothetical protein [Rickettsiales bacterium]
MSILKNIFGIRTTQNRLYKVITIFGFKFQVENFTTKLWDTITRPFLNFRFHRFIMKQRVIVCLTSFPKRIDELHYCIYSLLKQSRRPDIVALYLAAEEFPKGEASLPENLLSLRSHGLQIRWCENIGSYKKLLPALKEFPNDLLVTADDDLYYEKSWLAKLLYSYARHPEDINAHRAHRIRFGANGRPLPYAEWEYERQYIKDDPPTALNFATTGGGILYPPGSFYKDVENAALALKLCPTGDDIWFWAMCVLNGKKFRIIQDGTKKVRFISLKKQLSAPRLSAINCDRKKNDEQISAMLKHYPELLGILKKSAD